MKSQTEIVRIADGSGERPSPEIVGAKAANLAQMAALGLPVPPAFVLPIELCAASARGEPDTKQRIAKALSEGIAFLEKATGRAFDDPHRPLLVSVRSGAARSMPGMLDTILDVGCTPTAVRGLIRMTGNPRFAHDCRRRFLESYGAVVLGLEGAVFDAECRKLLAAEGLAGEQALDSEALERLATRYEQIIQDEDAPLAEDPAQQVLAATAAVHRSWLSERACAYRKLEHLEDLQGTAVTIQAMVFGNSGAESGAGVAFSRDPSSGSATPVIDVLFGSQGEDIVSGSRNPENGEAIARSMPAVANQLLEALARLEQDFGDVQDVEFTIENGKLWLLQTRSAKRTPLAALRFAIALVKAGRITASEGLQRLANVKLNDIACKRLIDAGPAVARGTGASAGVAIGRATFDADSAKRLAAGGDPVILVRPDTSTRDVAGFAVSAGVLTAKGGRTAHAALVARQMGKPCIVGCTDLVIDTAAHDVRLAGHSIRQGDWLSLDSEAGTIHLGRGTIVSEAPQAELEEIGRWRMQTSVCHGAAAE